MSQLEKQRLKTLLEDTITMVCRSSLVHQKFTVEGLLGITLQNDEVLLINLNRTIPDTESEYDSKEDQYSDDAVASVSPEPVSKRKIHSENNEQILSPLKRNRQHSQNQIRKDEIVETQSIAKQSFQKDIKCENVENTRNVSCLPNIPNPFWSITHQPISQLTSFGGMASWSRSDLVSFSEATTSVSDRNLVSITIPALDKESRRKIENSEIALPSIPALIKNCQSSSNTSEQVSHAKQHQLCKTASNEHNLSGIALNDKLCSGKNLSRKFHCTQCLRSFTDRHNLENHIRTHTGEKPYRCDICGKNFSKKGNMEQHMWTHSDAKPYTCTICNQGFIRKDYLTKHMERHSGTRLSVSEQQTVDSHSN